MTQILHRRPQTFAGMMAHALSDARLYGIPYNPINPDSTVIHDGELYSVEWLQFSFDTLSPTQVHTVRITRASTGKAVQIGQVIEKCRRNRAGQLRRRLTCAGVGAWASYGEAEPALVAWAAERLGQGTGSVAA